MRWSAVDLRPDCIGGLDLEQKRSEGLAKAQAKIKIMAKLIGTGDQISGLIWARPIESFDSDLDE